MRNSLLNRVPTRVWTPTPARWGRLLPALLLLLLGAFGAAAQVTVPTANTNTATARRVYTSFFGFERNAAIYSAAEINASGTINSVGFYLQTVSSPASVPVQIYMKSVSSPSFTTATTVATEEAGATLVYNATIPASAFVAGTWVTVPLTTPFAYNGTANLEVLVEVNGGGGGIEGSSAKLFRFSNGATNSFQYWNADNTAPTGTGTRQTSRPNIQLGGLTSNACAAVTPTVGTITGSSAQVTFSPAASGVTNYTVTTSPATTTQTVTASPVSLTGLMPSTQYTVQITSNCATGGTSAAGTASFTTLANCVAPTALATNTVTATSANLTFTAAASGVTNYTVTTSPATTTRTVTSATTAAPVVLSGLTPGTAYTVSVVSNCTAGGTSSTATTTFTTPIPNDEPTGAIAIPITANCTTPTQGTNVGATTTTPNGYGNANGPNDNTCGLAANPKDVWYTFTTAATGPTATGVQVNITGNPAGLVRVFSAPSSAGPFTQVACSSSQVNNLVAPSFNVGGLTPSTTYYVFVSGAGSNDTQGAFTLCVTTPPACGDPSSAIVTISATSFSIAFTPGTGNQSFTLTATPTAGGAPITGTSTGSPIQVTGLMPSTSYNLSLVATCAGGLTSTPITGTFSTDAPAPANDECASAISLTSAVACVTTSGTIQGATQSLAAIACGNFTASADPVRDVWYSFVASNTTHTIAITGTFDGVLDLRTGTCGSTTNVGCADVGGNNETLTLTTLTVGQTYFVRYYGYTNTINAGTFDICITNPAACAAPTALATNTVTTTSANVTFTAGNGNTGAYTVTLTPQGGTATSVTPAPTASPFTLTGLMPNTQYTVSITGNCGGGVSSAAVTTTFTTNALPPANDECASAISLTSAVACVTTSGTTLGATTSTAPGTCDGTADDDVWYSFVATNTSHTITVVGATGFDAVLNLRSGACPGVLVGSCADNSGNGGTETITRNDFIVGNTYLVRVYDYFTGSGSGNFTICITNPAACAAPTALATNTVTTTSANVTFTAGNGNTGAYTVTLTPQGGTATSVTPAPTASPFTLTGLMPNTQYTVSITGNCGGGVSSAAVTTTFTTNALPPANDLCSNAIALTCGQTVTGTTQGATATGAPTGSCGTSVRAAGGVFYSYVGTGDIVTVSTCSGPTATSGDTKLFVLSGSCGTLTCVDGNDDIGTGVCSGNNRASQVVFNSVAGTQYYFYVQPYDLADAAPFGLSVTCTPPPCNAPTALSAGSITSNSATVTFTASSSATGYTVTTTPATATQTLGAAATSVSFTGLMASTAYQVNIVSNCAGGATSPAATTTFTTTAPPCNAPTALTASGVTSSTATVGFTASNSATSYTVTTVPATTTQTLGAAAISATFSNLMPSTTYQVSIVSNCAGGTTSSPAVTSFTTTAAPICNAPTNLSAGSITQTSASVSFTAGTGNTSFTATATPQGGGTAVTGTGNSPISLTGLTAGTTYNLSLQALCSGGGTTAAVTTTFTTTAAPVCAAPGTPTFTAITQTSASVSFTAGANNVAPYTVSYTTGGTTLTQTGAASPIALTGLTAGTSYSVTVRGTCTAASGGAQSPASAAATLTTTAAPICNAPTNLSAGSITQTSASVSFTAGTGNTSFTATATPQGGGTAIAATGTASPLALTGLTASTTYTLSLQALCSGGGTTAAVTTTFTTAAPAPVCAAPGTPTFSSITATSASVSFTAGANNVAPYTVSYTTGGTTLTQTGNTSPITLTGLMGSTSYSVTVTGTCTTASGGAQSPASVAATLTTTAPAPNNLTVANGQNLTASGTYANITVQSGGTLTLTGGVSATGAVALQTGGLLITNCQVLAGSGSFTMQAGSELQVCAADGISLTGLTGAIQVTGTRSYAPDASYTYNGTVAQVTGSGLPTTVRNLTVNNAANVSLSTNQRITQVLRLQSGNLNTSAQDLILLSDANGTALVDNTGGIVNGTGTMQRAVTNSFTSSAYRHFSAPVSNTTLNDLTTVGFAPTFNTAYNTAQVGNNVTPFPTVFGYEQARVTLATNTTLAFDQGFFSPTAGSDAMVPNRGYTVNAPATAVPVDFVGTFNNATQTSGALARGSNPQSGWQFLGNPYPSPLDWSTVAPAQRSGMDAAMYVYQSTGQYSGTYRSYTNGMGTSPLIDAGSGYFARVTSAATPGQVNLSNANRVTTFGAQPAFGRTADTRPQLQLQFTGASLRDDAYFYMQAGATSAVDVEYDATKLTNPNGFGLASLSGNTELAINGMPILTSNDVIVPLTLRTPQAGSFEFTVANLANFGGMTVYLRDAVAGTQQLLTAGGHYQFTLAAAATGGGRFSLVFRPGSLTSTHAGLDAATVSLYPNPAHGSFTLLLPPLAGQAKVEAVLINALGQEVLTRTISLNAAGATAEFQTEGLATGVYMLRLKAANQLLTKRVVLK